MAFTRFDSALLYQGEFWLRSSSNPTYSEPANFKLILLSGSVSNTDTWEAILGKELTEANGYSRQSVTFSAGSVNTNIATFDSNTASITASGSNLSFDTIVVASDIATNANKTVISMTAADDLISVTGHGLSNTDKVMFTGAGTIATGLSKNTIYYARDVATDTFKVALTSGGAAINLTADSSGALTLRYANGRPEIYEVQGTTQTIVVGTPHNFIAHWNIQ